MFKSSVILACFISLALQAAEKNDTLKNTDLFILFENEEVPSNETQPIAQETTTSKNTPSEINGSKENIKPNHYLIYGDFLYWQPFTNDITWGNLTQNPSAGSYTQQYRFSFDWDVGFRVGLKFNTNWQNITLDGNWTSYHNVSSSTKQNKTILNSSSSSNELYKLQGDASSIVGFSLPLGWKINAKYTLDFDQYDFIVKKNCVINNHFEIKPYIGARGVILNHYITSQSFANSYNGSFTTNPPFDYSEIKQKNNSNAVGMVFGLDNSLYFGKGFSLFFLGDFFLGYGKNNSYFWNFHSIGGDESPSEYIFEYSHSMKSMVDIAAGFSWEKSFFKNALDLTISAGYEFHYIFQNPTFLYANPNSGTIEPTSFQDMSKSCGFQGLTIRGGFGF